MLSFWTDGRDGFALSSFVRHVKSQEETSRQRKAKAKKEKKKKLEMPMGKQ